MKPLRRVHTEFRLATKGRIDTRKAMVRGYCNGFCASSGITDAKEQTRSIIQEDLGLGILNDMFVRLPTNLLTIDLIEDPRVL